MTFIKKKEKQIKAKTDTMAQAQKDKHVLSRYILL